MRHFTSGRDLVHNAKHFSSDSSLREVKLPYAFNGGGCLQIAVLDNSATFPLKSLFTAAPTK